MTAKEPMKFTDPYAVRYYDGMTVVALRQLTKDRGIGIINIRDYKRAELIAELRASDKKLRTIG